MNLYEAERLAREEMAKVLDDDWAFGWDDGRRRFGACWWSKRKITLSRHLTAVNSKEVVLGTIWHEIAHAICGKAEGHGPRWRKTCIMLGGDGKRCFGDDVVRPPKPKTLTLADLQG